MATCKKQPDTLHIGWAQTDITPDQKVLLAGQFHARVSEGLMDPVTATALAIESAGRPGVQGQAVMVSCDLLRVSNELRDAVRERVQANLPALRADRIFIGATHTHSAPDAGLTSYVRKHGAGGKPSDRNDAPPQNAADQDPWSILALDIISPTDYLAFAADRIADAVQEAWNKRERAGVAYGLGHAVVGRCRRLSYRDGKSAMYGRPDSPEFRHVEGYEDHCVYAMLTYDSDKQLSGMIVNIPCPSQVSENSYLISADYWHETRRELRRRFGEHIHILAQCAPAGDQSPHVLIGKRAEERMWRLKGRDMLENAPREEIALKIADALSDLAPAAAKEIDWNPVFRHQCETLSLPRRMISEQDVADAFAEALPFRERYGKLIDEIVKNPAIRNQPRWYTEVTKSYRRMKRGETVRNRFELQKTQPEMAVEVHAVRIGDMAFATNPFELYLDYALRMRELCQATQTFLIQQAGCIGTYLPSARSIAGGGYGSVPASTDIGPEGGDKLVEWTVTAINRLFA